MGEPDLSSIFYHYRTPIYKYHQYQGETNNCGPMSLAISMNAFSQDATFIGENIANELDHWIKNFPKLVFPRISNWATFPWGLVQYLRYQKIPGKWSLFGSVETLIENIKSEKITIVFVGEPLRWKNRRYEGWSHIKVLFGYTPGQFYFVDPAFQKNAESNHEFSKSGIYKQTEEEFLSVWKNMFKIYVELG